MPEVRSQPAAPGPALQPHQFSVALTATVSMASPFSALETATVDGVLPAMRLY